MNAPSDRESLRALLRNPEEIQAISLPGPAQGFGYYRTDTRCPVEAYRTGGPPEAYRHIEVHRRFQVGKDPIGGTESPTLVWEGDRTCFEAVLEESS